MRCLRYHQNALLAGKLTGRKRAPSTQDKIAYAASMFVNPTASWANAFKLMGSQALKGVTDNVKHYKGGGLSIPFPFVDFKKLWDVVSDPTLFKGPEVSEKEGRALVAEYKRQYNVYKRKGGTRSYGLWIKWRGYGRGLVGAGLRVPGSFGVPNVSPKLLTAFSKAIPNHRGYMDVLQKTLKNYYGKGVDVHAMIGKLPAPKMVGRCRGTETLVFTTPSISS